MWRHQGPAGVAGSDRVAAEARWEQAAGPWAAKLVAAAIRFDLPRPHERSHHHRAQDVVAAMARDGVFFKELADVHPRFGTPAVAVVVGSVWAMVLAAWGTFESLLTYVVVFVGWIFYGLRALCVIV